MAKQANIKRKTSHAIHAPVKRQSSIRNECQANKEVLLHSVIPEEGDYIDGNYISNKIKDLLKNEEFTAEVREKKREEIYTTGTLHYQFSSAMARREEDTILRGGLELYRFVFRPINSAVKIFFIIKKNILSQNEGPKSFFFLLLF